MSSNFTFNATNIGYSMQARPAHTNNYITNYAGAELFSNYMYNKDNDFFNIFNDIFKTVTNSPQLIKSIRYYPFDISAYCDLLIYQKEQMTIAGKDLIDVFHQEPVKYLDYTYANNLFLLGDFTVPKFQGVDSFLSYEPYTYIKLYLPFYNTLVDVDTKRIKDNKLFLHGAVDFKDGDMVYILTTGGGEYLASYRAHIAIDIPLFYQDLAGYMRKIAENYMGGIGSAVGGNLGSALGDVVNTQFTRINTMQITSGSLDAFKGLYAPSEPALLVYRPRVKYNLNSTDYNHLYGVPCSKITTLSNLGGFTQITKIHTPDIPNVTSDEMSEIESLLREGIILDDVNAVFTINYNTPNISWSSIWGQIDYGLTFTNTFTLSTDYQLDSMTVTMGGVDITSTAVVGNTVTIPNVTGNILITAETSKIPETFTVLSALTGATLSNSALTVLEGERYETDIIPRYALGYIGKNYIPAVTMGGASYTGNISTFNTVIKSVTDDVVFSGTYPSVTDMNVSTWSMRSSTIDFPDDVETVTGVRITTSVEQVESTGSVVFDTIPDTTFNNAFISFEGNVLGGASNVTIGINQTGNVFYRDGQDNIVNVGFITNLAFLDTDDWTTQATLLEYMDKNFLYNG